MDNIKCDIIVIPWKNLELQIEYELVLQQKYHQGLLIIIFEGLQLL